MTSILVFFQSNHLVSICNKSTNNCFKLSKTQTLISNNKFKSMKTLASSKLNDLGEFHFKEYMELKMKDVKKALDETVPVNHPTRITEAMRYSLLGNKKLVRAIMCLASCELVGGDAAQAMPMACAVEMITTMSVMLDDLPCMDDDDIRLGKAASHKVFGEETTILAADSILCLAFQHIAEMTKNVETHRILRGIIELGSATGFDGMMGGELMDLNCRGKELIIEEVECIHRRKTGKLFEASTVCGAIMGGGTEEEIERLRRYGAHVGLMYQVVNDILDLTSSEEEFGKTPKKDLINYTSTYPKIIGIERSKGYAAELLNKATQELSFFAKTRASPLYSLTKYIVNELH